jgi:hypothetical protein
VNESRLVKSNIFDGLLSKNFRAFSFYECDGNGFHERTHFSSQEIFSTQVLGYLDDQNVEGVSVKH